MHLYLITRGIKHDVDRFITELQGKYLPFKVHKDGTAGLKAGDHLVQLAVRPIQLWEVVYPEECNDVVLASVLGQDGKTQHKKHNKFIWLIKKALGCEPIPEYKKDQIIPFYKNNIECIGIGVKKDYRFEDGTEAL